MHVDAVQAVGQLPLAQHRQRLRGEGLVELDQVNVGEGQTGMLQGTRGRWDRADAHRLRCHAGHRPGDQARERAQTELGGLLGVGHDADRGSVVLPTRVARGHGRLRVAREHQRFQAGEALERRVGPRMLVALDDRLAPTAGHRHGHDLLGERPVLLRRHSEAMGAQRELVLVGA